jgi:hypothetical protein
MQHERRDNSSTRLHLQPLSKPVPKSKSNPTYRQELLRLVGLLLLQKHRGVQQHRHVVLRESLVQGGNQLPGQVELVGVKQQQEAVEGDSLLLTGVEFEGEGVHELGLAGGVLLDKPIEPGEIGRL